MKVFLDTNFFVEFIGHRAQFDDVSQIIDDILDGKHTAFISTGSLYTLSYLFERILKAQGIHRPQLTKRLRKYLLEVTNLATLVQLSHQGAENAINDKSFSDIEDSLQYHCALENDCDILLTINVSDFKKADHSSISILSPKDFITHHSPDKN